MANLQPQRDMFGNPTAILKTSKVFVPGGMPSLTYVARTERELESRLTSAADDLCKLVTLTGPTKSGKTVLANRVFPRATSVWVDGGTVRTEDDLWTSIISDLNGATTSEECISNELGAEIAADAKVEAGIPLVAKGAVKAGLAAAAKRTTTRTKALTKTPRAAAIAELRRARRPLVIDDFHYLDKALQGSVVRALKPLIFEGLPVVCIAIPHRRYDVVKVEKEMTGRLEAIKVPAWTVEELVEIPQTGFPLLNVSLGATAGTELGEQAYGSPHLMQEFCRRLATEHGVNQTSPKTVTIAAAPDALYKTVSEGTGKVIFDKLKKGPRQRSDRKPRQIIDGGFADVYEAVLLGLAALSPGLERVDYEQLRTAIKSVLVGSDVPQAHQISRVLEKMSEIASSDGASTPVLDWDKEDRQLHITDPFFAFFLKWGLPATA